MKIGLRPNFIILFNMYNLKNNDFLFRIQLPENVFHKFIWGLYKTIKSPTGLIILKYILSSKYKRKSYNNYYKCRNYNVLLYMYFHIFFYLLY